MGKRGRQKKCKKPVPRAAAAYGRQLKIKDLVVIIIEDASFMAHLTKEGMHPNIILFYSS